MLRKLLICPWFGDWPEWWKRWKESSSWLLDEDYRFLITDDLIAFKNRVAQKLDVDCPIVPGGGKIHDYRATFGHLFADELAGYDYWGHTDFDCVYGRVEHFMPDERLAELDLYSDHPSYLCGPWTLYRNTPQVNELFRERHDWREILEYPETTGWVESEFTRVMDASGLKVLYELNHGYLSPHLLNREGRVLREGAKEISFFHFKRSKVWPKVLA